MKHDTTTRADPRLDRLQQEVKSYREILHQARHAKREAERAYRQAQLETGYAPPDFLDGLDLEPNRFLAQVVLAMHADDQYSYQCDPPFMQDGLFVVSTANVNEFQARYYGPLLHAEMRKIFRVFATTFADAPPEHFRLMRSNFPYEPGEVVSTCLRAGFDIRWLTVKGGSL